MSEVVGISKRKLNNFIYKDSTSSFIAGGIAGCLSRTAVSPFERVKVLYQVQGPGANSSYNDGVIKTVIKIWKEEGFKGLFRGNGINCIRVFPYSAVQYACYQYIKPFLLKPGDLELTTTNKLIAGGISGAASVICTYPLDLVKTRLSIQTASLKNLTKSKINVSKNEKPPGMFRSLINIYHNEGKIWGLYRGIWPTTLGVAPYVSLNFTIYEKLKEFFVPVEHKYDSIVKLLVGAASGGISQTLIYPFDILRRRFQVLSMGTGEMGFAYTGVTHALVTIVKLEGYRGLYKGLVANLFKICPSMAIQWASYELIKEQFI
ncbi:hypothetical protein PACTADRAFT_46849 [Pachysolen tannophilus NRRL Y-2460]|uniref:Mitochondrial carrier protein n=1 Tax=Pachysolen tannophilus NRRL Y-2460 TaxID=669874 RepID=A0A1E4TNI8_PACTA|nr:hypothetical protein PACTADRAFT_46849 [Pachysolen tannophilus NRRL Y-2460]